MSDRVQRGWIALAASGAMILSAIAMAESPTELLKVGKYSEAYEQTIQQPGPSRPAVLDLARNLLEVAFESPDEFQRWYALRATRFAPDPQLIPSLRRIAREADRYERSLALDGLLVASSRDARDELIQAVASDYRPVRVRGLRGLVEQADASLVPVFTPILARDDDPNLRALAARGLGRSGSPEAIEKLRPALDDPSDVVRDEVTQALVMLNDGLLTGNLAARLAHASSTAERIRWIRLMRYLRDERKIEILAPTLGDADPQVRTFGAASMLAVQNQPAARSQTTEDMDAR